MEETCTITEEEVKIAIYRLAKNKAVGEDNIPAEFLQTLGENGLQIINKLMNSIYQTGKIPSDCTENIFIPIPKVQKAQDCNDFRTISFISHTSKILLRLIKDRIRPIIEKTSWRDSDEFQERKRKKRCHVAAKNNNSESVRG